MTNVNPVPQCFLVKLQHIHTFPYFLSSTQLIIFVCGTLILKMEQASALGQVNATASYLFKARQNVKFGKDEFYIYSVPTQRHIKSV